MVRQKAILDLALQFDNACTAKEDLRKAYEKCNDIPQESRALIDAFLKKGSDKDYELNLSMYGKAAKIKKQMNAKLVWLLEKYNYRSQTYIGGSSSQTHEICDLHLTEKELHQLHLDEEALRETLEEAAMDEKARGGKLGKNKLMMRNSFWNLGCVVFIFSNFKFQRLLFRYKYPSPSPHFLTQLLIQISQMDSNFNNENDPWDIGLDIDDSDLHLTPVMRSSSSTRVEPSPLTPNPVRIIPGPAGIVQLSSSTRVEPSPSTPNPIRIIPGPAGIVQQAKLLKEKVFILDSDGALMSTQEYMQKVVEDVGEDDDFKSGSWVSVTNYVNAFGGTVTGCLGDIKNFLKNEKLDQVVAIVKSCSPNVLGDLTVTMKDLSGTIPGTISHKVIDEGGYGKDITVGAAMILANVSVFTHKPSKHYLNIAMRNVVEVFRKDTIYESGSG
ncbi:transposase, MuDR, MULE transposase domain protein [Tanacetum coccineum]